jgi:hypothetical protein
MPARSPVSSAWDWNPASVVEGRLRENHGQEAHTLSAARNLELLHSATPALAENAVHLGADSRGLRPTCGAGDVPR